MDKGTIVAVVPMDFPTIILESGKTIIINIIKGIDLNTFIIPPKILLNKGFSQILSFSVITNNIPKGNPSIIEKSVEKDTIYIVSKKEGIINSAIISPPHEHFHFLRIKRHYLFHYLLLLTLELDGLHWLNVIYLYYLIRYLHQC